MGTCFDKKFPEQEQISSLVKPKVIIAPVPHTKKIQISQSQLLSKNIINEIILEEESVYAMASQSPSICESSISSSISAAVIERSKLLGQELPSCSYVRVRNLVTGRWLHSHAVKPHNPKLNEVCVCEDGQHEHDRWQIIANHCDPISDGDTLMKQFHHSLTHTALHPVQTQKLHLENIEPRIDLICAPSQWNQMDQIWQVELLNQSDRRVKEHSLIKIKHLPSQGYLHAGSGHGQLPESWVVSLCFRRDVKDIWIMEIFK